jgi:hypothetical protein
MLQFKLYALTALLFLQTATDLSFTDGILIPKEKEKFAKAVNVEQRIKVYESATVRIHQTLHKMAAEGSYTKISESMRVWNTLLAGSLQDIEANLKTKKKSRPLIRYEIQVRKLLKEAEGVKNSMPAEEEEMFKSLLAQAEVIRKRFMAIIFKQ